MTEEDSKEREKKTGSPKKLNEENVQTMELCGNKARVLEGREEKEKATVSGPP